MFGNFAERNSGERIKFISEELGNVESSVEQYKRNNKLTDITSEANLYLQSGSESEKKLIELGSELKLVDFMLSELKSYSSKDNLIPTNLGLKDESIAQLIVNYNKTALDIKRLTKNAGNKEDPITEYEWFKMMLDSKLLFSKTPIGEVISTTNFTNPNKFYYADKNNY